MADDRNTGARKDEAAATGGDSESALRDELRRETKEAVGGIGDIAEDRNLTGSSSWLTEPKDSGGNRDDGRSQR